MDAAAAGAAAAPIAAVICATNLHPGIPYVYVFCMRCCRAMTLNYDHPFDWNELLNNRTFARLPYVYAVYCATLYKCQYRTVNIIDIVFSFHCKNEMQTVFFQMNFNCHIQ